jgi:hypothetical protein
MSRPGPALLALLGVAIAIPAAGCGRSGERSAVAAPSPAPAATAAPPAIPAPKRTALTEEERRTLVGWWLRFDEQYMIVIEAVAEDGRLTARYLNPGPVNVSRAEAWKEGEVPRLLVELTDEGYPGSFYELAREAERDLLVGVYHNLAVAEDYEVYFTRFEEQPAAPAEAK